MSLLSLSASRALPVTLYVTATYLCKLNNTSVFSTGLVPLFHVIIQPQLKSQREKGSVPIMFPTFKTFLCIRSTQPSIQLGVNSAFIYPGKKHGGARYQRASLKNNQKRVEWSIFNRQYSGSDGEKHYDDGRDKCRFIILWRHFCKNLAQPSTCLALISRSMIQP